MDSLLAVKTLNTPLGIPASAASYMQNILHCIMLYNNYVYTSAIASAHSGVSSEGLSTTVHPAANAAPALRVAMAMGKFH